MTPRKHTLRMLFEMMQGRAKWMGATSGTPDSERRIPYHPAIVEATVDPQAALKKYWAHVK